MFGKYVKMGNASLCCLSASAGHVEEFANTGDGKETQFTYVLNGSGTAVSKDNTVQIEMVEGQVIDMTSLMGKPFVGTANTPSLWVSINPIPCTLRFTPSVIRESQTVTGETDSYLICIDGQITANNKALATFKFARIPEGMTVDITVPEGSMGLYLNRTLA